ncbi:SIS domain-containing protein [soil metagenome]|nr:SIS domain-containing protein [Gemmatimonadota bacterium]
MTSADALETISTALEESADVKRRLRDQAPTILRIAERIADAFRAGNRLYACGNGGSACDAMHLVEELVARYKRDRPGLPAHHLLDAATLTCWSNDYDFATVFERQVQAFVRPGDVLVAISTSGNSPNVLRAVEAATRQGAVVVGLTGRDGGQMRNLCDEVLIAPSDATERIQEAHIAVIHLWCELLERMLFSESASAT